MSGFTLVEIMVVFGLLALTWAVMLPPFNYFQKSFLLFSTANSLASELRSAQESAQSLHGKEKISFVLGQNQKWFYQRIQTRADASEKPFIPKILPKQIGVSTNLPQNSLIFNNSGNPQKAGQINLSLAGFVKKKSVVISPVGRIRVTNAL